MPAPLRLFSRFLCAMLLVAGFAGHAQPAPPTIPGRLVFRLKTTDARQPLAPLLANARLQEALRTLGASAPEQKFPRALPPHPEKRQAVDLRPIFQLTVPAGLPLQKARTVLLQTGLVAYVEPLYIRQPLYQPNDLFSDSTRTTAVQYYLKNIKAYRSWDFAKGDSNIVIGVTDTGFLLSHQDLKGKEKRNYADPIDGLDNDQDGYVDNFRGWDLADDDNDPAPEKGIINRFHGVAVSGVAAARADNKKGIAGVSFNCRYLPLKIYSAKPTGMFAGYEAIVYAADHGCQIINMSWGGIGGKSQYEQDLINYAAINRDAVLVAAAGNTNEEQNYYPASYDHVMSVAMLTATDQKVKSGTYSYHVDLSAPGEKIQTTAGDHDSAYSAVTGSSFAAPMVAAAAALVRSRFPDLSAAQVVARLRASADSLYTVPGNATYRFKLGAGRLNMQRALAAGPLYGVRLSNIRFVPPSNFQPNDTLSIVTDIQNLLDPLSGVQVTLTTTSPYLSILNNGFLTKSMSTLGEASNLASPFVVAVAGNTPMATPAVLRFHITAANGYSDDQFVPVILNPGYVVLDAGNLHVTLTSQGNLGYEATNPSLGESITYRNGPPLLSLGGLLVGTTPERVSDRMMAATKGMDADFTTQVALRKRAAPLAADQEAVGSFQDVASASTVGVRVLQHAYAWSDSARRNFVRIDYDLINTTPDTLRPLYAGLLMDWDLPTSAAHNAARWDGRRQLGYVYDQPMPLLHAGVQLLGGGRPMSYAIENTAPAGSPVRLADGFSAAEKFLMLSSDTTNTTAGTMTPGADVSQLVGAALPALAPGDSVRVSFAILAAGSLDSLRATADAARRQYQGTPTPIRPAHRKFTWQVYPNPATDQLWVEAPAAFKPRQATLLDGLGRPVAQWAWGALAGRATFRLPATLAAGLYVLRLEGDGGRLTRQVVVQRR